jgi:hypothetical protein
MHFVHDKKLLLLHPFMAVGCAIVIGAFSPDAALARSAVAAQILTQDAKRLSPKAATLQHGPVVGTIGAAFQPVTLGFFVSGAKHAADEIETSYPVLIYRVTPPGKTAATAQMLKGTALADLFMGSADKGNGMRIDSVFFANVDGKPGNELVAIGLKSEWNGDQTRTRETGVVWRWTGKEFQLVEDQTFALDRAMPTTAAQAKEVLGLIKPK